jgi:hypothetical protein
VSLTCGFLPGYFRAYPTTKIMGTAWVHEAGYLLPGDCIGTVWTESSCQTTNNSYSGVMLDTDETSGRRSQWFDLPSAARDWVEVGGRYAFHLNRASCPRTTSLRAGNGSRSGTG